MLTDENIHFVVREKELAYYYELFIHLKITSCPNSQSVDGYKESNCMKIMEYLLQQESHNK